ncbi:MAG: sigma-70 family RNA polymerase sigma factor [Saprospiraceae bacterium]|nr:sigma-70 family RNA polymerase sigma factor [Saprospiraceae bacterium]
MIDQQEAEILTLIRDENTREKGFRMLMMVYQERIYWHIRKFVFDHDDANDIMQNTFIKVYRGIDKFKGDSKLYTWLYRISSNESITYVNNRKRRATASIDDGEYDLANQLKADVFFDGDEAQLMLQQAVASLPDKQRLVFNMKYFDDLSYQEISEILDTSVGALKASYHHAVKKIQGFFKDVNV